ncbi:MAG: hypothetical protein EB078_03040 [Proteobacteria bacterium]|nr:hypothetical protein [Pseudomonadota bacterium]NDC24120.1 hypothetical protein [Pseudomonadota bacterium]NDD03859.1 hypothetical protein [Pseudomonadota bacterium]NDG26721.1 hypothetical protein [Pseudomonadota bacterium]
MKIQKATVAAIVVVSLQSWGLLAWAEKGDHSQKAPATKGATSRDAVEAPSIPKLPGRYAELIEALNTKESGKPTVISCGTGNLTEDEKVEKLLHQLESLKNYRTEMDKCDDEANKKFKGFIDSYIDKLHLEAANKDSLDDISKKQKKIVGLEAALRYHEPMKAFLTKKASELEKYKDKFAKADAALLGAIESISEICTLKKDKDGKPEYSKDAQVEKEIVAFEKYSKETKLEEANACALDEKVTIAADQNASTVDDDQSSATAPDHDPAPPTGNGNATADASGGGGPVQGQPVNPQLPPVISQGTPITGGPGIDNGLNGGPSDFEQQLINELIRARQDAVRPNEIGGSPQRDNSRSFQFPPVSVSPQPQSQQQYPPQQQQYPQQQMPPFPYAAMMQPPVAQPIPAELLAARQPAQNPNAAANAAQTQALMEMAKMQQQLMQAQMQNQMMMNQNMGTSNINNIRNRTPFRGARGSASRRFMSRGRSVGRSAGYRSPGAPVTR